MVANRVRKRKNDLETKTNLDDEDVNGVANICADLDDPNASFKICLLVDSGAMMSIHLPDQGVKLVSTSWFS